MFSELISKLSTPLVIVKIVQSESNGQKMRSNNLKNRAGSSHSSLRQAAPSKFTLQTIPCSSNQEGILVAPLEGGKFETNGEKAKVEGEATMVGPCFVVMPLLRCLL